MSSSHQSSTFTPSIPTYQLSHTVAHVHPTGSLSYSGVLMVPTSPFSSTTGLFYFTGSTLESLSIPTYSLPIFSSYHS